MGSNRTTRMTPATAPARLRALLPRHWFALTHGRGSLPKGLVRCFGLIAIVLSLVMLTSCGGNSTTIGVTITPSATSAGAALPVIEDQTQTFSASVTGGSATTVYWQICLPVPITTPPTQPTTCTPIPVTGVTIPGQKPLSGYGTITQNGVYTAPNGIPQQNPFLIVATSTIDFTAFGTSYLKVDSGIRVQVVPNSATIGASEIYAISANVTGSTNTAVTWSVANVAGGSTTAGTGTIQAGGPGCPAPPQNPPATTQNCATYTAPDAATSATVTATSSADPSQSASATITVTGGGDPAITSIDPNIAQQGSVQQDVNLTGTNFLSTSTVLVNGTPIPATWISTSQMLATIPSSLLATSTTPTTLSIEVQRQVQAGQQTGDVSAPVSLSVIAARPVVTASSPDSVPATSAGFGLTLTGGFFSQSATSTTFDGFPGTATPTGSPATETFTSSRQMIANIPANGLSTPGLYPLVVQNKNIASGSSSTSFANIAVTALAGSLPTSAMATIGLPSGASPSAIAVDQADGLAVVANTGTNSVSIINLATNSVTQNLSVGKSPTGVAVDDGLLAPLDHIAIVVNSGDNTLSTIDLKTNTVSAPFALPALPAPQTGQPAPVAYSVGVDPMTHHAIVAITSTNVADIVDFSTGAPALLPEVGGSTTNYGTGPQPNITVDPRLNWAIVTWGGGGVGASSTLSANTVNIVDLGRTKNASDPGRNPTVIGTLTLGTGNVLGVGINAETRQTLITTPSQGSFTTFSLLDQSVSTVPFTNQGLTVDEPGYVAAAVSSLSNIGVAVNANGGTAAILDLQNSLVIQNVTVGKGPIAVAIDPTTNEALVANQTDGTVSVVSLGTVRSSASLGAAQAPQITLSSPEITYTSASPLTLTVTGAGFASGAQVFLDGTALASVSSTARQIVATVPPSMLNSPRRYAVYVQTPGQSVISNVEDLIVVQPIPVGAQPFGVGIDTECDVAAVTNSGDNTVSIVALTANSTPPGKTCASTGSVGTVGTATPVGTTPQGIAVDSHLGLAVVANNGSNNASVVDLTEINPPSTQALCGGSCTKVTGVAINPYNSVAFVTDVMTSSTANSGNVSGITLPPTSIPASATSGAGTGSLDLTPSAVAIDPYLNILGVAIAGTGQPSTVDIFNSSEATTSRPSGFQLPTGIIFDPVNQVFVVADSLSNNVGFIDPSTAISAFTQVGMNPTALDYNYQASTLVTENNATQTMSIANYVCPPNLTTSGPAANCSGPQVRDILPIGGSPQFSVAIDPKLNLAVLADETNNRILLIPLP